MAPGLFDLKAHERAYRCLQLAAEAEALARNLIDPEVAASYRRIALRWKRLAAEAEAEAHTEVAADNAMAA